MVLFGFKLNTMKLTFSLVYKYSLKKNIIAQIKNVIENKTKTIMNIIPVVSYFNADIDKSIIYKENKNKSGIYRWNNLITGKSYIGSSISLSGRFNTYYSLSYLKKRVEKGSSIIYNSLLKYGYSNFSLDILEYCEPSLLISKEQYYIDLLKPEYNILKKAGSRLGTKQSFETKQVISSALKGRTFSDESKAKMINKKLRQGFDTSFFGKTHTVETISRIKITKSLSIKITDIEANTEKIFVGNIKAAKYLGISESTLRRYKKKGKIFQGKYLITNV